MLGWSLELLNAKHLVGVCNRMLQLSTVPFFFLCVFNGIDGLINAFMHTREGGSGRIGSKNVPRKACGRILTGQPLCLNRIEAKGVVHKRGNISVDHFRA